MDYHELHARYAAASEELQRRLAAHHHHHHPEPGRSPCLT